MTLAEKRDALVRRLQAIPNPQDRLNALVLEARKKPGLPEELRTDAHRVDGCLSRLWFLPEFSEGRCSFQSDSDSLVVKAVSTLLCDLYSGHPPREILQLSPEFLGDLGITQHLTTNRRNGLSRLWEMIRAFALSKTDGIRPS